MWIDWPRASAKSNRCTSMSMKCTLNTDWVGTSIANFGTKTVAGELLSGAKASIQRPAVVSKAVRTSRVSASGSENRFRIASCSAFMC